MPPAPAAEQSEPCNFRETLSQWEDRNRPAEPARPTSRPGSGRQAVATPRIVQNKNFNRCRDEFNLTGTSFEGTTFVRTNFGESRRATTRFDVSLCKSYTSTLLSAERPNWCAYGDAYTCPKTGNLFNYDAIVYELARLSAIADFHDNLMEVVQAGADFGHIEPDFKLDNRRGYVHLAAASESELSSRERLVVLVVNATGSRVHVRGAPAGPHPLVDITKGEILDLINDLGKLYKSSGSFNNFVLAYLCGIHSMISVSENGVSGIPFFRLVLEKVEFPRPFGNFANVPCNKRIHTMHRPAIRNAMWSAAMVTVSDPGNAGSTEWTPTISSRKLFEGTPHISSISRGASSFFRLWLINCSALFMDEPQSPSEAVLASLLSALRKTASYFKDKPADTSVAAWYGVEPTHILHPCQIYAHYGSTQPLAPPNGVPIDLPALKDLVEISGPRAELPGQSNITLDLRMHSVRNNLLLWIMEADSSSAAIVPAPLRSDAHGLPLAVNAAGYQKVTLTVDVCGIHGLLDELALGGDEGRVQVVVTPLSECSDNSEATAHAKDKAVYPRVVGSQVPQPGVPGTPSDSNPGSVVKTPRFGAEKAAFGTRYLYDTSGSKPEFPLETALISSNDADKGPDAADDFASSKASWDAAVAEAEASVAANVEKIEALKPKLDSLKELTGSKDSAGASGTSAATDPISQSVKTFAGIFANAQADNSLWQNKLVKEKEHVANLFSVAKTDPLGLLQFSKTTIASTQADSLATASVLQTLEVAIDVVHARVAPQAPTPQAPTPQAPTPQAPTPQAPTPQAPTPQAPSTSASTKATPAPAKATPAPTAQAPHSTQAATPEAPAKTGSAAPAAKPEALPASETANAAPSAAPSKLFTFGVPTVTQTGASSVKSTTSSTPSLSTAGGPKATISATATKTEPNASVGHSPSSQPASQGIASNAPVASAAPASKTTFYGLPVFKFGQNSEANSAKPALSAQSTTPAFGVTTPQPAPLFGSPKTDANATPSQPFSFSQTPKSPFGSGSLCSSKTGAESSPTKSTFGSGSTLTFGSGVLSSSAAPKSSLFQPRASSDTSSGYLSSSSNSSDGSHPSASPELVTPNTPSAPNGASNKQ